MKKTLTAILVLAMGGSLSHGRSPLDNKISIEVVPNVPYAEICFKNGETYIESHGANESTEEGDCVPGDTGFIIETKRRSILTWRDALDTCLKNDMRLPTVFEWLTTCEYQGRIGGEDIDGSWEWALNYATPTVMSKEFEKSATGLSAPRLGRNGLQPGVFRVDFLFCRGFIGGQL